MGSTSNFLLTYVALCASDGVGVGTSQPSKDGWVPKFASLINAQQTVNLGRSGSTLADALRQQLPRALEQNAHVITIWLAVNDFNQQIFNPSILTSYKANLNDMLSQLRSKSSKDTRILVGNIPDLAQVNIYTAFGISKQFLSAQVALWNDAIRDIVQKNQCELVDLFAHWKELATHPEYISYDGFHPSAHGYTRLADVFYQQYSHN
ncbi:unnamed protein product [Adineta ricciae]|uniref:SGNH hydrolase-type esterase domain-containing protein n=1 Tax=Adineta ricciae TaxID=249248 RepID=A0A813PU89_ADIRI|nr:unnamed protein product [Adineta ricciae]CAF0915698.1 unnamed protein product [Adineta ricciae]